MQPEQLPSSNNNPTFLGTLTESAKNSGHYLQAIVARAIVLWPELPAPSSANGGASRTCETPATLVAPNFFQPPPPVHPAGHHGQKTQCLRLQGMLF
jgi:hypothetical protein